VGNRLLSEERIERERARWTQGGERTKADGRRGMTIIVISIWDMKQGAKSITINERNRSAYLLEI